MAMEMKNHEELLAEIKKLSLRAEESEQTIQAIQNGEVDAIYVDGPFGGQVYTLKSVDHTYKQIVEEMNQGSFTIDEEGIILYGNQRLEELFKKPLEKVIGSSIYEYVEKKDQQLLEALIYKGQETRVSGEISFQSLEGDVVPSYLAINPLIVDDEVADVKVLLVVLTDLTEQKQHEEVIKSEKFSRTILEQAGRAIVVCDQKGQIIRANEMAQELSNVNPLLKNFDQIFPLINISPYPYFGDKSKYEDSFSIFDVLQGELHVEHEVCYISPSENKIFFLLLSSKPLKIENKNVGAIITLADITEKREFEKKIVHLNLVLKAIRNVNQLITHEKDVERLINQICNTLIENRGYGHALIFISDGSDSIIAFDSLNFDKSSINTIQKKLKSEEPECLEKVLKNINVVVTKNPSLECSNCLLQEFMGNKGCMIARIEHAGKIYGFLNVSLPAVLADYQEEQSLFIEVAGDIAFALHTIDVEQQRGEANKSLENSRNREKYLADIIRNASVAVGVGYPDGRLGIVNTAFQKLTGYSEEELKSIDWNDVLTPPEWVEEEQEHLRELERTGKPVKYEKEYIRKDGSRVPIELVVHIIFNSKGDIGHYFSFITDITERKIAESKMKKSLQEKEILLREVHHRVKNNLQIIVSLLHLQECNVDEEEIVDVLKESEGRIKSMAMVHEKLYQSPNFTEINFKQYLEKLIYDILYIYGVPSGAIKTKLVLEDINLNIDTSIPLGLIVNELVTNSVKHAFPHGEGTVKIEFKSFLGEMLLIIEDNGIGLPANIEFKNTGSLGLQLVNSLINQLEGEIELERNHGTKFTIKFKELKYGLRS
jgi:PAS domain S-box-containing protein